MTTPNRQEIADRLGKEFGLDRIRTLDIKAVVLDGETYYDITVHSTNDHPDPDGKPHCTCCGAINPINKGDGYSACCNDRIGHGSRAASCCHVCEGMERDGFTLRPDGTIR